eukprot:scaffold7773_cov88-Skeletonema_dohrnii-CCMP3373.AAC.1
MAGTAFFRHSIPYEVFYGVHFLFLAMYAVAVAHTIDVGQRSGKKDRSQTFKWFAAPLIYYLCDYAMMWFNQRARRIEDAYSQDETAISLYVSAWTVLTFNYSSTSSAFLRVESIDRTWHPFSIASDPDSNAVEFYIEVIGEGSWTERLWTKLKNQDKHQTMNIDLLGPYGTALVKDSSYTNIVAIGTGTGKYYTVNLPGHGHDHCSSHIPISILYIPGIVPCTSLLKQHVRKMAMMDPAHYFAEQSEQKKHNINIICAQEDKNGSLVSHLVLALKGFMSSNQHRDVDEALEAKSAANLKSHTRRQSIQSSLNEGVHSEHRPSFLDRHRNKAALKIETFKATAAIVTVFSLNLSWNLTTADVSSEMLHVLEILTVLLHAIFFLCSFFIWNGASLQSYFDAAISIILPFADWHYTLQSSLSTGQVVTLSLLNGYITFRFYQKTLATVAQQALKESVELRTVKVARQLLPEINETYESLVKEWGEHYARQVLDVTIYITDKDRAEAASFRAQIRDLALFKSKKVVFIRPKLGQIVEDYVVDLNKQAYMFSNPNSNCNCMCMPLFSLSISQSRPLVESHPAYSSTLLAFCGGPKVSGVLAEVRSNVELLAAATGYSSHQLDFVSESYGGAKPKPKGGTSKEASKKEDSNESLWDVVRQETIQTVNTIRVKSVFEDEDESYGSGREYKSKRELMEDYERWGSKGGGLRHRSCV